MIPLFPLSHVLLPGMPLPLHIFEQRYCELLADISAGPDVARFGVVALRSGTEAATPHTKPAAPDVEDIGTLAEILDVQQQDDGTSDLLSVGSARFRIERLVPHGKAYLRAEITFLDEPDGTLHTAHAAVARELMETYDELLIRLAGRATGAELPTDANQLSYQIGARLPLPPAERQALLRDPTTAERLTRLSRLLRREITLLQRTRTIAVSPTVLRMAVTTN